MKSVLIIGSGAREHALAWKLRQSSDVGRLYVAPGNAGTRLLAENVPLSISDFEGIARFVQERDVALTVVGPEAPLALGLADRLRSIGRRVVGPSAAAARIEASKAFAKEIMARAGVPTAAHAVFDEPGEALRYVHAASLPCVVKADGLAAGKGVTVCADREEACAAVTALMRDGLHGDAGRRVIVEEALVGPEVSLLALVDGERVVTLPVAQDHKRLGDGDTGPNTGGMGAYAPVPFLDERSCGELSRLVLQPIVAALTEAGAPFRGFLFAGLMLTEDGPRVLEYNCRLGDPEAQAVLPLVEGDLLPWLEAIAGGALPDVGHVPLLEKSAVGVVLAASGYPEAPVVGEPIRGLGDVSPHLLVFHAGTALDPGGRVVTAGGRVLTVVGTGPTVEEAARRAYGSPVQFDGMQLRGDIARQAMGPDGRTPASTPQDVGAAAPTLGPGGARIAVLASGDGSNLQAVLDACAAGDLDARVAVVVSHNPGARALERARIARVPAFPLPIGDRRDPLARRRHEEELLAMLAPFDPDLIVLAGWMLILSAAFLAHSPAPLINVHPALLPDGEPLSVPVLRGARAVRDAIALGLPFTGVSVHVVTPEVDAGPVLAREVVPIESEDDEASLYTRIKTVEHRLVVQAIGHILSTIRSPGGVYA